ncbi:MAG TPA: hypothetical protein VFA04_14820 [Bryobacteraceae bacterium]|nr:hypothetical protein [Bryobacteraceae bacterium]
MTRVLGVALLSVLLNAQSKPAAYVPAAGSVAESIDHWQKETKVAVDEDARAQIADQAGQLDWSKVFVPAEQHDGALAWTNDIVVRAYLYSLLDRDRARQSIKRADVADHTLAKFAGTLRNQPFGFVEFLSAPSGGAIRRDGQEIGRTPMGFIVPGDPHTYDIVLSKEITCESTIQTRPGTTDRMTCPE